MPKLKVQKSITIDAPIDKVYSRLNDFHHWLVWSPWLIAEPEAKVNVNEDGKYYEWEGNRVGSGNMTVEKENAPNAIEYDLTFLKPWKSKAKTSFQLREKGGDQTEVTWFMDSSLPFFMFWMKKMMVAFIGQDYERGLTMLKEYVEDGKVNSKLEFVGTETYDGCNYIGVKRDTTMDAFGPEMQEDFENLLQYCKDNNLEITSEPFSIYHKFDMVKQKVSYTGGVPVSTIPGNLPTRLMSGTIPATKIYRLRHVGAYKHLGNAWTTMYMMQRNKELKSSKKLHPFELYVNGPDEVSEDELITDICFALK